MNIPTPTEPVSVPLKTKIKPFEILIPSSVVLGHQLADVFFLIRLVCGELAQLELQQLLVSLGTINDSGVHIGFDSAGERLGEVTMSYFSPDQPVEMTVDTILSHLEAGGCGSFHVHDVQTAAKWVASLALRLSKLEEIWPGPFIFDAIQARNNRQAAIA